MISIWLLQLSGLSARWTGIRAAEFNVEVAESGEDTEPRQSHIRVSPSSYVIDAAVICDAPAICMSALKHL